MSNKKITQKQTFPNIEKNVMAQIEAGTIKMKPRWYFVVGTLAMAVGLLASSALTIFLLNLSFFLTRQHGPMGDVRLQYILESFPLWIPIVAIVGMLVGVWLLKKYDFSYKKNFLFISLAFVISLIVAAFFLDYFGINEYWASGPMRKLYQDIDGQRYQQIQGKTQGRGNGRQSQ